MPACDGQTDGFECRLLLIDVRCLGGGLHFLSLLIILFVHNITIQSRRLTLLGHIMRMDDNADAKKILLAFPPADWKRQPGRPRIAWLSTVQQEQHHLKLPEAADLAQNRPLWSMMSTYGATQF